jgi:hypothetical protein
VTRHRGTLRPHRHAGPQIGFDVVSDPDPDNPFTEVAFAATPDLQRAGVVPASGVRISYRLHRVGTGRSARAVDIEADQ